MLPPVVLPPLLPLFRLVRQFVKKSLNWFLYFRPIFCVVGCVDGCDDGRTVCPDVADAVEDMVVVVVVIADDDSSLK